jgi:hypothetical protein
MRGTCLDGLEPSVSATRTQGAAPLRSGPMKTSQLQSPEPERETIPEQLPPGSSFTGVELMSLNTVSAERLARSMGMPGPAWLWWVLGPARPIRTERRGVLQPGSPGLAESGREDDEKKIQPEERQVIAHRARASTASSALATTAALGATQDVCEAMAQEIGSIDV